jgi:murein DD-endopeptidase MepM/ murein hydrolase activator NlpD
LSITLPVFANEIDDLKKEIDQRAQEIGELKAKETEYESAVSHAHKSAHTLEEVILDFNRQINKVENGIVINRKEISAINLEIKRTELEILDKEEKIKRVHQYIAEILREIYANSDDQVAELLLKYENFSDFFNQVEYRELLQKDLGTQLDDIKNLKKKLETEKAELDSQHAELKSLKDELENKNDILDYQKSQKEDLLGETRNQEWRYKDLLKITVEKQEAIQREIFELEDKLRQAIDAASIPAPRPGVLSWPTEGLLTQNYGCTEFARSSNFYPTCFHNGIDIAASYGTEIKSARAGVVIAVQNAPYAYGKWIAIEHDNGLVTLYGHLSLQSVDVGQNVASGDIIGYMGSTGFSTGSHLHFTVYAPLTFTTKPSSISGTLPIGATLNPFDYLP